MKRLYIERFYLNRADNEYPMTVRVMLRLKDKVDEQMLHDALKATHCPGVFHCRTDFDDNHHRNTFWFAEHEAGYASHLAVRHEGEVEAITAWLSQHIHECAVVLRGGHLDLAHPCFLWPHFLHHHHWHTLRKDAFPFGKAGPVTIWQRIGINLAAYVLWQLPVFSADIHCLKVAPFSS